MAHGYPCFIFYGITAENEEMKMRENVVGFCAAVDEEKIKAFRKELEKESAGMNMSERIELCKKMVGEQMDVLMNGCKFERWILAMGEEELQEARKSSTVPSEEQKRAAVETSVLCAMFPQD